MARTFITTVSDSELTKCLKQISLYDGKARLGVESAIKEGTKRVRKAARRRVAVRSGAHCAHPLAASMGLSGTIRVSFGVYNTPDDVLAACAALAVAHDLGQQEK